MRVLCLSYHPSPLSESYMRTEIEWMLKQGVEVGVLGRAPHNSSYQSPAKHVWTGEPLAKIAEDFKPDVVHVHHMTTVERGYDISGLKIPVTIRAHSFDHSEERARRLCEYECVKKLWMFPHLAIEHPKVEKLTSCFPPSVYYPATSESRDPWMERESRVIRAMAGIETKNITTWLEIASLCRGVKFLLIMSRAIPPDVPEKIMACKPPNVEVQVNVAREEVASLVRKSAIYLTNAPDHPFGMPASAIEAMASGLPVVAQQALGVVEYLGPAGYVYNTPKDAAAIILDMMSFSSDEWEKARQASLMQAKKYTTDVVLPRVLQEWRRLSS